MCNSYSVDIRFISRAADDGSMRILAASISLFPLPAPQDLSFQREVGDLFVGQWQNTVQAKQTLLRIVEQAISGVIMIEGRELRLVAAQQPFSYSSEMALHNRWFNDLHLKVIGDRYPLQSAITLAALDDALRGSSLPFDGMEDLAGWFGLPSPFLAPEPPTITIRIAPPADLMLIDCELSNNRLALTVHAHPELGTETVALALLAVPGNGLGARRQVAEQIRWSEIHEGRRAGTLEAELEAADQALAILMIGGATVRRQWFLDPAKARNNRLLAVQQFDSELRMIRRSVLEPSTDPTKFELGVAALLFLLGFSPLVQIETDSPDIIVMSPGGRVAIVECTTRIADFNSKLGKLVDRRGALSNTLSLSGHRAEIVAVLACALPRDQIAVSEEDLSRTGVTLVSKENLSNALDRVRNPGDPDQLLASIRNPIVS